MTTGDDPIYATATLASPASAAVTGESTLSPTLDTRSASPRASAATGDNTATVATTRRSRDSTPRPFLTNLVYFTAGKESPLHTRPLIATLSRRSRRHGARGNTPTTTLQ